MFIMNVVISGFLRECGFYFVFMVKGRSKKLCYLVDESGFSLYGGRNYFVLFCFCLFVLFFGLRGEISWDYSKVILFVKKRDL